MRKACLFKMQSVYIQAHAKVNLTLDVLGKRHDGYHDIASVMQSISLCDRISLHPWTEEIRVVCRHPQVPDGKENIVYKAAAALRKLAGIKKGVLINVIKGIPVAAGLGGGSADAAAVLRGLNIFWEANLRQEELLRLAVEVGADVPFCLKGGTALAEGIGERLSKVKPVPSAWMLLVKPRFGVSTKKVYENHNLSEVMQQPRSYWFLQALEKEELFNAIGYMGNALQKTTVELYPEVQRVMDRLKALGCPKVQLCGSGPTVFAPAPGKRTAEEWKNSFGPFQGQLFVVHTVKSGILTLVRSIRGGRVWRRKSFHQLNLKTISRLER